MAALLGKVWGSGNRTIEDLRCIYENDDILVIYTRLKFRSGSREAAMSSTSSRTARSPGPNPASPT